VSLPSWLSTLVSSEIVGIAVARRTPAGIETRCWLEKDIPLRVAGGMVKALTSAVRAVFESLVLVAAPQEEEPEPEAGGGGETVH